MDKGITWPFPTIKAGKASVGCQIIPKLEQYTFRVLRSITLVDPVMQVDFDLAPSLSTMLDQQCDQIAVVLFRWIKVGMTQAVAIGIDPRTCHHRIIPAPSDQTTFLFPEIGVPKLMCHRRLEMISNRNDQVKWACERHPIAGSSLPDVCRQPPDVGPDFVQMRLHIGCNLKRTQPL